MKVINDFKFTLNVSREGYENKKDAIACLSSKGAKAINREKMAFKEVTVTSNEFLNYAVSGHSFCNLFEYDADKKYFIHTKKQFVNYKAYPIYKRGANKGCMKLGIKSDDFFKSSQVVFIDIDYTRFTEVSDYIDTLTFKPTCVYMSYSDNIYKEDVAQKNNPLYTEKGIKSRRFRMVYVFDEQLDKEQLNNVSFAINNQIEIDTKEDIQDKCGVKVSQYFNGCFGNKETYNYNVIYSYNDIYNTIENKEEVNGNNIVQHYYNRIQKSDSEKTEVKVDKPLISYQMYNDMCRLPYDEFMHYYRPHYQYIYRVEKDEWINNEFQFTDDNYFSLYFNVNTLKDGNKRRKKLFERICLRRVMNPDVDAETLFFDAYEDVHRFFDNSDDVLDAECLRKNVESSLKYSIEEIKEKYSSNIAYLKSKRPSMILKKGVAFTVAERNIKLKENRYKLIDEVYNPNLSVKENLENICNNVFSICEKTLYNYCKDRGISTKPTEEEIMSLYDFNLSLRKNVEIMKKNGLKVGKDKLAILVKKYSNKEEANDVQTNDNVSDTISTNLNITLPEFPSISEPIEITEVNTKKDEFELYHQTMDNYLSNWMNKGISI